MSDAVGELVVEKGCLERSELDRALRLQAESGQRLGPFLISLGLVAERDLAKSLVEHLGLELTPFHTYGDQPVAKGLVSPEFLKHVHAVPVVEHGDHVVVAMGDPFDSYTLDALRLALGRPVVVQVGVISEIEAAIARQYGEDTVSMAEIAQDADGQTQRDLNDIQHLRDLASVLSD